MSSKIGRNDPCPCGSGKKYKKCCLKKPAAGAARSPLRPGRFRFDPGAYGQPEFGFVPALLNEEEIDGEWHPHFLLANPARPFDGWTQAAELAIHDLDAAFAAKTTGGDGAAAQRLHALGYKSVGDFRLDHFRSIEVASGFFGGSAIGEPDPSVGTEGSAPVREAFLEAVEEQIRSEEPKEAALTFERLVAGGQSEEDAKSLIAMLMAAEVFHMTKEDRPFDEDLYVENLRRLPELPEELR